MMKKNKLFLVLFTFFVLSAATVTAKESKITTLKEKSSNAFSWLQEHRPTMELVFKFTL